MILSSTRETAMKRKTFIENVGALADYKGRNDSAPLAQKVCVRGSRPLFSAAVPHAPCPSHSSRLDLQLRITALTHLFLRLLSLHGIFLWRRRHFCTRRVFTRLCRLSRQPTARAPCVYTLVHPYLGTTSAARMHPYRPYCALSGMALL